MINSCFYTYKPYSLFIIPFFLAALLLTACSNGNEVSIEGRMLHMNQAEFYLYSTDGVIEGIDTIHVQGGRFEYDKEIQKAGTMVMVFPNYTQIPLFVEPGSSIEINGDAAKLKDLEVSGNSDNETFTDWRADNVSATEDAQKVKATQFIADNPYSPVSLWMIRQYFILSQHQDIKGALALLDGMIKYAPDNIEAKKLRTQIAIAGTAAVNEKIGHFSATDTHGNLVNDQMLQHGTTIIMTLASWNFDSQSMLRTVSSKIRGEESADSSMHIDRVLVISLDADIKECRRTISSCGANDVTAICDGQQFDSPLLRTLHLTTIPDNILVKDGKVVKSDVDCAKL